MFAKHVLTDEERKVDPELGYPRGYAKLCRNAHTQMKGLITPYTEGPPQRFLPYTLQPEDMAKLKEFNQLFPITESEDRDPSSARRYADSLWQQLDHLGNAGFDPAKFRIDPYGNVLYLNADPGSPLAWEVDHWFPHSRGGKTIPSNLRLVQWQVNQRKQNKLEFLIPWWDLQIGVSVSQFLSFFASKNSDFRQRAFSLLFFAGENEQLDGMLTADCHSWPLHFRERKCQFGLAPAAIVRVQKETDDTLRPFSGNRPVNTGCLPHSGGTPMRRRWTIEEEEALRRAIQKFGPGNWKEIKENEPLLSNRSAVQIKDKYRLMKGDWELEKENMGDDLSDKQLMLSRAVQKESMLKKIREEEIRVREEEISQLDKEMTELQQRNEAERLALEDLESVLIKHRRRVEKQRRWSEAQSSYRTCLEKMIRDAMHQSIVYKEQGRLNQAACNALMARLESQKASCNASEMDLIKKFKQREDLETLLRPYLERVRKRLREDDVASNCQKNIKTKLEELPACCRPPAIEWPDSAIIPAAVVKEEPVDTLMFKDKPLLLQSKEESPKHLQKELRVLLEEEKEVDKATKCPVAPKPQGKVDIAGVEPALSSRNLDDKAATKKIPCLSEVEESELDVLIVGYEYEGAKARAREAESVGENVTLGTSSDFNQFKVDGLAKEDCASVVGENDGMDKQWNVAEGYPPNKPVENDRLDELLEDLSIMQRKAEEEKEDEEERIKRAGKSNLDKWLQLLLLNPEEKEDLQEENNPLTTTAGDIVVAAQADESKSIFGGFLKKLSFKQQQSHHKKIPIFRGPEEKQERRQSKAIQGTASNRLMAETQESLDVELPNSKEVADDLDLAERLKCLKLAVYNGEESDDAEPDTNPEGIATTVNLDTELQKHQYVKESTSNADEEIEKQNRTITATIGNKADVMFKQGAHSLEQQEDNSANNCQYITNKKESGGGAAGGIVMEKSRQDRDGNGDGFQGIGGKECRLQRSDSVRVLSNSSATASLWTVQRTEQCNGSKTEIEEEENEQNEKLEEIKGAGEDGQQGVMLLKNGLSASIKTCTHVWKKAVKRLEVVALGADQTRAD